MHKKIEIPENTIKYHVDDKSSIGDVPWKLLIKDIKVIGIVSRMLGDDDSLFLILVDSSFNKNFITLNNSIENLNELESFLLKTFSLNLKELFSNHYDEAIVTYPNELLGKKFYKSSFLLRIARFFGFVHTAEGELDDKILEG